MATPFLGSEEYDERAHRHYADGDFDRALETLKEGVALYPHAVDLHVGLGFTRLAREEFAWARHAFEAALVLDPEHDDALVGMGEVLLRLGRHDAARALFARVRRDPGEEGIDLLLSMGRALYREGLYGEARAIFDEAVLLVPENGEALAALAYALHREGGDELALRKLRQALALEPRLHEARVYLGHLLYDRGEWKEALAAWEAVPAAEHWDTLALWRVLELKQMMEGLEPGDGELLAWEARLEELEEERDAIDEFLAELEAEADADADADAGEPTALLLRAPRESHCVVTPDGRIFSGTWLDIVAQLRDACGHPGESVAQFMRRLAEEQGARAGSLLPADDPEDFLRASARAGLLQIEY